MHDDARVDDLLEEMLESGGTPEEVCWACPEVLPQVRAGWQRLRAVETELDALFPQLPATEVGRARDLAGVERLSNSASDLTRARERAG